MTIKGGFSAFSNITHEAERLKISPEAPSPIRNPTMEGAENFRNKIDIMRADAGLFWDRVHSGNVGLPSLLISLGQKG